MQRPMPPSRLDLVDRISTLRSSVMMGASPHFSPNAERAADVVLALINSRPRTPTRDEVAAVIGKALSTPGCKAQKMRLADQNARLTTAHVASWPRRPAARSTFRFWPTRRSGSPGASCPRPRPMRSLDYAGDNLRAPPDRTRPALCVGRREPGPGRLTTVMTFAQGSNRTRARRRWLRPWSGLWWRATAPAANRVAGQPFAMRRQW
jgi:hypothetical protein